MEECAKKVPLITRCKNGKLHGRNFYCFFSGSNTPEVWGRYNSESYKKNQIISVHFWVNMFALTGKNFDNFQKKANGNQKFIKNQTPLTCDKEKYNPDLLQDP